MFKTGFFKQNMDLRKNSACIKYYLNCITLLMGKFQNSVKIILDVTQ